MEGKNVSFDSFSIWNLDYQEDHLQCIFFKSNGSRWHWPRPRAAVLCHSKGVPRYAVRQQQTAAHVLRLMFVKSLSELAGSCKRSKQTAALHLVFEQFKVMLIASSKGSGAAMLLLSQELGSPGLLQLLLQHPPHCTVLPQALL